KRTSRRRSPRSSINTRLPAGQTASCGVKLRRALAGLAALAGASAAATPRRAARKPVRGAAARAADAGSSPPEVGMVERGVEIVFNDGAQTGIDPDADGIVVKRFDLKHVAAPR